MARNSIVEAALGNSVYLVGPSGAGKSVFAANFATKATRSGLSVEVCSSGDLFRQVDSRTVNAGLFPDSLKPILSQVFLRFLSYVETLEATGNKAAIVWDGIFRHPLQIDEVANVFAHVLTLKGWDITAEQCRDGIGSASHVGFAVGPKLAKTRIFTRGKDMIERAKNNAEGEASYILDQISRLIESGAIYPFDEEVFIGWMNSLSHAFAFFKREDGWRGSDYGVPLAIVNRRLGLGENDIREDDLVLKSIERRVRSYAYNDDSGGKFSPGPVVMTAQQIGFGFDCEAGVLTSQRENCKVIQNGSDVQFEEFVAYCQKLSEKLVGKFLN